MSTSKSSDGKPTTDVASDKELTENELDTVAGGLERTIIDVPLNPVPPGTMAPSPGSGIERPVHDPIIVHDTSGPGGKR